MRSRRALLYVPGDDRRKIEKAASLPVDCICLDLEDGVAVSKKEGARPVIEQALRELDFGVSERCIRINGVGSGWEEADLTAALHAQPDALVLPKVETADQVRWISGVMESYELSGGLPLGQIRLLIGVETALGILNLKEIAGASNRLDAIIFGGEDFAASVGAVRTPDATELLYARLAVVTACAAFHLQAIDIVTVDFRNLQFALAEAESGARLGFSGKQVIHPGQVEPVQQAFTPSDEAVAYALKVAQTFEAHQREGKGAYELDGKMIDLPLLKNAEKVLARARAAGKLP